MQLQPLPREGLEESVDLRVGHHPSDLRPQHLGPLERARSGGGEQRVVGQGTIEEVGEATGQFEVVQFLPLFFRITVFEVEEALRCEYARQCREVGCPRLLAAGPLVFIEGRVTVDLIGRHRPPPGPLRKPREALPHLRRVGHISRPERFSLLAIVVGDDRALKFDRIDDEQGKQRTAVVVEQLVAGGGGEGMVAAVDEQVATQSERLDGMAIRIKHRRQLVFQHQPLWHRHEPLELEGRGVALVGQHVGIEERRLRLLIPDRQVGHAAMLRPQARERDLHPVDAGLIEGGAPPGRPAGNRMPRPDQVSHLVRHADRRRPFVHLLPALR